MLCMQLRHSSASIYLKWLLISFFLFDKFWDCATTTIIFHLTGKSIRRQMNACFTCQSSFQSNVFSITRDKDAQFWHDWKTRLYDHLEKKEPVCLYLCVSLALWRCGDNRMARLMTGKSLSRRKKRELLFYHYLSRGNKCFKK